MFKRKWKEVYERLPIERKEEGLTRISGFTNFCSDARSFRLKVLQNLLKEFPFGSVMNVCEVGCGCGDKLTFFYQLGHRCFGVDYSHNMIERAKKEMPDAQLHVSQANRLPFPDNAMDFVFSYGVAMYFESTKYLYEFLKEIYRIAKPGATICIWDVPDVKDKGKVLAFRGKHAKGYEHTYYDMNDLIQWFKSKKILSVKCEYSFIPEYRFSFHRFNITAVLNKRGKRGSRR